jgi:hypothetical protein
MTTVGGGRDFHNPTPREGVELGIKIRSGGGVDKEMVFIDQDMASPIPADPEPSDSVDWTEYEIIAIFLVITSIVRHVISSIVRDAINSIQLFYK